MLVYADPCVRVHPNLFGGDLLITPPFFLLVRAAFLRQNKLGVIRCYSLLSSTSPYPIGW